MCCPRCGSSPGCARAHAWRHRGPVRDLAAHRVFADVPVLRVVFCTGATASLMPAALWRGRSTIASVVAAAGQLLAHGLERGHDWVRVQIPGGPGVSRSTLGRWREAVVPRVSAAALALVGLPPGNDGHSCAEPVERMARLAAALTPRVLAGFRARFGRAVLDLARSPRAARVPRTPAPPIPGRLAPAPPPATGGPHLPRGARSRSRPRGPPRDGRAKETTDD